MGKTGKSTPSFFNYYFVYSISICTLGTRSDDVHHWRSGQHRRSHLLSDRENLLVDRTSSAERPEPRPMGHHKFGVLGHLDLPEFNAVRTFFLQSKM